MYVCAWCVKMMDQTQQKKNGCKNKWQQVKKENKNNFFFLSFKRKRCILYLFPERLHAHTPSGGLPLNTHKQQQNKKQDTQRNNQVFFF